MNKKEKSLFLQGWNFARNILKHLNKWGIRHTQANAIAEFVGANITKTLSLSEDNYGITGQVSVWSVPFALFSLGQELSNSDVYFFSMEHISVYTF